MIYAYNNFESGVHGVNFSGVKKKLHHTSMDEEIMGENKEIQIFSTMSFDKILLDSSVKNVQDFINYVDNKLRSNITSYLLNLVVELARTMILTDLVAKNKVDETAMKND